MEIQKNKIIFISIILTTLLFLAIPQVTAGDSVVSQILLDPEEPAPTETITFVVTLESDASPTNVYIFVQECNSNICYKDGYNITLTLQGVDEYIGQVTLEKSDATYIKYQVAMQINGGWNTTDFIEHDLFIDNTNGDTNGENGDNGSTNGGNGDNTPGFELVSLLIAGGLIIIAFHRKRFR
jgi:hypothetical protein